MENIIIKEKKLEEQLNVLIQEQLNSLNIFHNDDVKKSKETKNLLWHKIQRLTSAICAFKMCGIIPRKEYIVYLNENFNSEDYFNNTCAL